MRLEAFNVFNRANFAPPNLSVYAGGADVEQPLPNFGRIRSTVTSSRQIQLGVRLSFDHLGFCDRRIARPGSASRTSSPSRITAVPLTIT